VAQNDLWEGTVTFPRRTFLHLAAGTAAFPALSRVAAAQAYPTRTVRIMVGFVAGGTSDILARLMGQWLSERLGRQFVIENRPGASGNIATEAVVRASPDGHTLLLVAGAQTVNATLYDKLSFSFIRDIAPVASISRQPNVLVVNSLFPVKSIAAFIAYAKANPGKINMASAGIGAPSHIAGEMFKMMTGVNNGPRALSWRRACVDRSARRTGTDLLQPNGWDDRVHQGRHAAPASGEHRDALGGSA
jgi:tripartite-type tricarboxylate transporter receptor subunit TctC